MTKSEVQAFEDERWRTKPQKAVFRHRKALEMAEGHRILDIGCGDGLLLGMLRAKGCDAVGVDMSEEAITRCREKGFDASLFDVAASKLPFQDNAFDCVILLDVLEHVYAPDVLLQEATRVSKKYVIISVPNFNSLPVRLQVLCGKVPENNRPNKGHVYWFNRAVLNGMLSKQGLTLVETASNTFFGRIPVVGSVTRLLATIFPGLFGLSFVVKAKKV